MGLKDSEKISGAALVLGMSLAVVLASAGQIAKAEEPELEEVSPTQKFPAYYTEVSYTYVSLEYEVSNTHQGSEGVTLGFSFEVAEPFHVFGGYQGTTIDLGDVAPGIKGERRGYLLGGGVKQRIGEGMTLQYRLGYVNSETDIKVPGFGIVDTEIGDGHYAEVGIRTLPWPKWEIDGFVANFSTGQYDNNMLWFTLERRVHANLGINFNYRKIHGDNPSDTWIFALRYHLWP